MGQLSTRYLVVSSPLLLRSKHYCGLGDPRRSPFQRPCLHRTYLFSLPPAYRPTLAFPVPITRRIAPSFAGIAFRYPLVRL